MQYKQPIYKIPWQHAKRRKMREEKGRDKKSKSIDIKRARYSMSKVKRQFIFQKPNINVILLYIHMEISGNMCENVTTNFRMCIIIFIKLTKF